MSMSVSSANFVPNLLALLLFVTALLIAIRALFVYARVLDPRLFILGLAMSIISLTALADFIAGNVANITLNTDWFLYIGQGASLLFILLSLFNHSDAYDQRLVRTQILVSALLIGLCLLSPSLPAFPNIAVKAILSSSRSVICFGIFYAYMAAFLKQQNRFSLLMSISFFLLALGYLMVVQQYFITGTSAFDNAGDIIRMFGLTTLLVAVFAG